MSQYRRIATDDLVVDERYQRPIEKNRVAKIAEHFDARLFGALEVSRRNGVCAVFDGQHRLQAARLIDLEKIPCFVHENLKPEEEAELFVRLQRERKSINPKDRFKARVFFGDPVALELVKIARSAGFELNETEGSAFRIRAISSLERAYGRFGGGHLGETLSTLKRLWGGDEKSNDGGLIEGLALFLKVYEGTLRDEHFERLQDVAPATILRRAVGPMRGGSMAGLIAAELKRTAGIRGRTPTKVKS